MNIPVLFMWEFRPRHFIPRFLVDLSCLGVESDFSFAKKGQKLGYWEEVEIQIETSSRNEKSEWTNAYFGEVTK